MRFAAIVTLLAVSGTARAETIVPGIDNKVCFRTKIRKSPFDEMGLPDKDRSQWVPGKVCWFISTVTNTTKFSVFVEGATNGPFVSWDLPAMELSDKDREQNVVAQFHGQSVNYNEDRKTGHGEMFVVMHFPDGQTSVWLSIFSPPSAHSRNGAHVYGRRTGPSPGDAATSLTLEAGSSLARWPPCGKAPPTSPSSTASSSGCRAPLAASSSSARRSGGDERPPHGTFRGGPSSPPSILNTGMPSREAQPRLFGSCWSARRTSSWEPERSLWTTRTSPVMA